MLQGRLEPAAIRDKTIIIGVTVTGSGDVFPTPFDPLLPGVEVMATAIAHLITGDGLIRDWRVRLADTSTAVVLPILMVLLLAWQRTPLGVVAMVGIIVVWGGLTAVAFTYGFWLSATLPLAAAIPSTIVFGAVRLWLDRPHAEDLAKVGNTLRNFQPPSLVARLQRDPNFLLHPVRQRVALVFIDLSGFTGLSEAISLGHSREIIRDFHVLVDGEASKRHSMVVSFMGDGAMIVFGLPEPSSDDAANAVETSLSLCSGTQLWLSTLPHAVSSRLSFKIGAHYGTIIASRLGGDHHQHITAIGDSVNVASRLMEVAAAHEAKLALSEDLLVAAGSTGSALGTGLLHRTVHASLRGRSANIAVRLWGGGDDYAPESSPYHLRAPEPKQD